jgi:2-keto-3-deoxy-6-phosphogluconate aldolase
MGSKLITRDAVAAGEWDKISANVEKAIALVEKARGN